MLIQSSATVSLPDSIEVCPSAQDVRLSGNEPKSEQGVSVIQRSQTIKTFFHVDPFFYGFEAGLDSHNDGIERSYSPVNLVDVHCCASAGWHTLCK